MAEKIAPVLSAEEWDDLLYFATRDDISPANRRELLETLAGDDPARLIAVHNAVLPDSDHRKITRERIDNLRCALSVSEDEGNNEREGHVFLDALESYFAPEGP